MNFICVNIGPSYIPTDSGDGSVTIHNDVSSAGSGEIITALERSKLNGIEAGATADQTGAEIKLAYEGEVNTNAFTDAEKSKVAGLESSKFLGEFISLLALQTAFPSPTVGSYANVDAGASSDVERYVWDDSDSVYVLQLGTSTSLTDAQIKTQYENNPDTNAYTDSDKTKSDFISVTQAVNLDTIESDTNANNAKVSNVSTDLSIGAISPTTVDIDSSDGNNVTIPAATQIEAGLLTAADKTILDNLDTGPKQWPKLLLNTTVVQDINVIGGVTLIWDLVNKSTIIGAFEPVPGSGIWAFPAGEYKVSYSINTTNGSNQRKNDATVIRKNSVLDLNRTNVVGYSRTITDNFASNTLPPTEDSTVLILLANETLEVRGFPTGTTGGVNNTRPALNWWLIEKIA